MSSTERRYSVTPRGIEMLPAAAASMTLTPVALIRLPTSTRGDWPSGQLGDDGARALDDASGARGRCWRRGRSGSPRPAPAWRPSRPRGCRRAVIAGAAGGGCVPILVSARRAQHRVERARLRRSPVALTTSPIAKAPRACDATSTPPVSSLTQVGPVGLVSSTTPLHRRRLVAARAGVNCSSSAIVVRPVARAASTIVQVVDARAAAA